MFVWKKTHVAAIAGKQVAIDRLDASLTSKDETIGRLQRENARLLDQVTGPQEQKDEGATYVLKSLAECLGLADWHIQSGSETWEGDVSATMYRILVDAGVIDDDDNAVATHKVINGLNAQLTAEIRATQHYAKQVLELRPDAEKHRARVEKAKRNLKQNRGKPAQAAA